MRIAACVVVALCGTAVADDVGRPALEGDGILDTEGNAPRIAVIGTQVIASPKERKDTLSDEAAELTLAGQTYLRDVSAMAADKKAYWTSTDLADFEIGCGMAPCPPPPPPPAAKAHATFLWQLAGKDWELVAFDVAPTVSGKAQASAIKKGVMPAPIAKKIDAGAEDAVKVFEASIGDPKTLAATVSTRKEVVLYGNEPAERTVGGAKVKAKLEAWKLAFKVRDGIQAGTTSSKTIAWVVANLDSTSTKKPKDKPVPYRLFALYEKTGADWKLVSANFAYLDRAAK